MRIEDLDTARVVPGAEARILATLEACGFEWDATPVRQSTRLDAYRDALVTLATDERAWGRAWHVPHAPAVTPLIDLLCAARVDAMGAA